ncbi:hypothetical protein V6N13_135947 [Hibiscus sabdariffa]
MSCFGNKNLEWTRCTTVIVILNISTNKRLKGRLFPTLFESIILGLDAKLSIDEIRNALFVMAPFTTPGSDGLHDEFLKKQWHIVGIELCRMAVGRDVCAWKCGATNPFTVSSTYAKLVGTDGMLRIRLGS